jgi:hypothetical protein
MKGATAAAASDNLIPGVKPSLGQKGWQYCWWSLVFGYMIVVEFDRYRLTSVIPIPIPVSVRCESNRYRFEINNKLDIGIGFGIGWKCNKVSIGLISVNIGT